MNEDEEFESSESLDNGYTNPEADSSELSHGEAGDPAEQKLQDLSQQRQYNMGNNRPHFNSGNNRPTRRNNPQNHQRPNMGVQPKQNPNNNASNPQSKPNSNSNSKSPTNNNSGPQNLKNSIANKGKNLFNSIKNNNKSNSSGNEPSSQGSSGGGGSSSESSSETHNELGNNPLAKMIARRIIIKVVLFAGIALLVIVLILAILAAVFGVDIAAITPAVNPNTYGTDGFQSSYDKNSSEYKNEIKYYEKLKEVSQSYAKDHGEELKTNYIHSILIYYYYQVEVEEKNESGETIVINYGKMLGMVDSIVDLMKPSDDNANIDYEKNGEFYNNVKESTVFKNYYSKVLKEKNIDELLSEIFDFAKSIDEVVYKDDTVLASDVNVTVADNSNKTTKTLTINEYISDSIYANAKTLTNGELVKAYTIAYSTNLAAKNNKLTVDSKNITASNTLCSTTLGCSYDSKGNLVSGPGSQSSKNTLYYNGGYYYKLPLTNEEKNNLTKNINAVFGNVLVNSDGTYPELDLGKLNGLGDGDYKTILANSYGNLTYKNIGEDNYILDGSYGSQKVQTKVIFYDQNDYGAYNFCGKKNETIQTSGCGVTSMAIIVSTYENNAKYDPVSMMSAARSTGYCGGGIVGTSPGFFKKEANTMKYKYLYASKYSKRDLNLVLQHLSQGHLVVAHMLQGHFTSGGHYMVLGGVDPSTKKVYVYDPYNKVNKSYRKTGNGWYSFNDIIVKEAKAFYIVWKG